MTKDYGLAIILAVAVLTLTACSRTSQAPELVALRVTSDSDVFTTAVSQLAKPCNNPAEFGRCGCYMDGVLTTCDLVGRCLELGFCRLATEQQAPSATRSQSPTFSAAAAGYADICSNPAEFGRCGCFMDGLETYCSLVSRCLELGFCVATTE